MAANPLGDDAARSVALRTAYGAAKLTATGATVAFVLAGTAVPAFAQQVPGKCVTTLDRVTCTYNDPTVDDYVLQVPLGVSEVTIEARGAAGGDGGTVSSKVPAAEGGPGGYAAATFPVHSNELLHILVGGHGQDANGTKAGRGGSHGGADGGSGAASGGGGGGASSVRIMQPGADPRIIVAGGGGGAGGAMTSTAVSKAGGGAGGGDHGGDGQGDNFGQGGAGAVGPSGGAGLQTLLGLDGHSGYDADFGGGGGEGGYGTSTNIKHSGTWAGGPVGAGGGGGGYAGGSGGAAGAMVGGGGGGGSGMVATSSLAPTVARLGSSTLSMGKGSADDGMVVISYRLPIDRHGKSAPSAAQASPILATPNQRNG
jgi:hypothetical protein